jgi:hypothetical protein
VEENILFIQYELVTSHCINCCTEHVASRLLNLFRIEKILSLCIGQAPAGLIVVFEVTLNNSRQFVG